MTGSGAESAFRFELLHVDAQTGARRGRLHTPHGAIETPVFMPVGTRATVKAIAQDQLEALGAQIILANTYHLFLRPGHELIRQMGGLHAFMSWPHPILTDSGGFQIFSLSKLMRLDEDGASFRSHIDGAQYRLAPEDAIDVQLALGADIIMAFDDCTAYPASEAATRESLERTNRWARRCRERWLSNERGLTIESGVSTAAGGQPAHEQALFGIVQGGMYPDLRRQAADELVALNLPGYAIGGLSVGEPRSLTYEMAQAAIAQLPADKPRYLMGVGTPEELVEYAGMGVDMMDCVLPTRSARNGLLFTSAGKLVIKNVVHARDPRPPDEACGCPVCGRYSRAYLRHLYLSNEILASSLNSLHNIFHYLDTLRRVRHAIELNEFQTLRSAIRVRTQVEPSV